MDTPTPELQTVPLGLYDLVQWALLFAFFALFAYFVYSWTSRNEVSARYRPSVFAGLCLTGVAMIAYVLLYQDWDSGFRLERDVYVPNEEARTSESTRYIDWSVTVPLLMVELLAVCSVSGAKARPLPVLHHGRRLPDDLHRLPGIVGVGAGPGRHRAGRLGVDQHGILRLPLCRPHRGGALVTADHGSGGCRQPAERHDCLLGSFGVYPLVYAIPVFADVTPAWLATLQVCYSVADVIAKVGFGVLIHKVAKLRTAEDVVAGVDTHPEPVWSSHVHKSDGVLPEPVRAAPPAVDELRVRDPRQQS